MDDALEVPVKLELISVPVVDEHRMGPDVYKKKMMEAMLRATAERVILTLKELQLKVSEKVDNKQCKT